MGGLLYVVHGCGDKLDAGPSFLWGVEGNQGVPMGSHLVRGCLFDQHRCAICHEFAPNGDSNYVFQAHGLGKHDGKWLCEACLEQRLFDAVRGSSSP